MLFLLREPASFHIHHEAGGKALYIEQDLNKTLRYQCANSFWGTHKWTLFKRGRGGGGTPQGFITEGFAPRSNPLAYGMDKSQNQNHKIEKCIC